MKPIVLLALLCALFACAAKEAPDEKTLPADCPGAYVILPVNFIIDLSAGSEVVLNPAMQEFALFCRPEEAQKALEAERANLPPDSDWRIYRLEGAFHALARPCHGGQFCLAQPAVAADWVQVGSTSP